MGKTISGQLVETLVETGIQRIYAETVDGLNHLKEAPHRNGEITSIHTLKEDTAAYSPGA